MYLDIFLNVILKYYKFFPGTLDEIEDIWEIVRHIARTVSTHWEKPDKGNLGIPDRRQTFCVFKSNELGSDGPGKQDRFSFKKVILCCYLE